MTKETQKLTLNPDIEKFQEDLIAKYAEANKNAKKGQILFIGSSLMEIFPIEKWEEKAEVKFDSYIYNRAVRATTTQFILDHIQTQIFDLAPAKIFINIGTNDIGFGVSEDVFHANYEKIIRQIQEKLPATEIYLMKYYPTNRVDFGIDNDEARLLANRSNEALDLASEKNQEMAERLGIHFIDVNAGLSDAQGNLKKELTFDGSHMFPEAYKIVLNNMKKYLEKEM